MIAVDMTVATAMYGDACVGCTFPSAAGPNPSRPTANSRREAASPVPRAEAKADTVAPRLMATAIVVPRYVLARSTSGDVEPANAATPWSSVPKPIACV